MPTQLLRAVCRGTLTRVEVPPRRRLFSRLADYRTAGRPPKRPKDLEKYHQEFQRTLLSGTEDKPVFSFSFEEDNLRSIRRPTPKNQPLPPKNLSISDSWRFPHTSTAAEDGNQELFSKNAPMVWGDWDFDAIKIRYSRNFFDKKSFEGVALRARLRVAGRRGNFKRPFPEGTP